MLKMLKWEAMKWYHWTKWIIVFAAALIAILGLLCGIGILKENNYINYYVSEIISSMFFFMMLYFCILAPSANMIVDYVLPHKYLEITAHKNYPKMMLVKIIGNLVLYSIGVVIGGIADFIYGNFIHYVEMSFSVSVEGMLILFLLLGVIIPIFVLFFYMLSHSIKADMKIRILVVVILMAAALGIMYGLNSTYGIYRVLYYVKMVIPIPEANDSTVSAISKVITCVEYIIPVAIISVIPYLIENKYEPR